MKEFTITTRDEKQRFDKYLKKLLPNATASFLYKMMRKKNITLNGKKCDGSERLSEGDEVKLNLAITNRHAILGGANGRTSRETKKLANLGAGVSHRGLDENGLLSNLANHLLHLFFFFLFVFSSRILNH